MFVCLWAFHVLPGSPLLGWIFDITEKNVVCIEDAVLWQPGGSNCNMLKLLFTSVHILNFQVTLQCYLILFLTVVLFFLVAIIFFIKFYAALRILIMNSSSVGWICQLKVQYVKVMNTLSWERGRETFMGFIILSPVTNFFLILRSISMSAGLLNLLQKLSWFP